MESLELRDFLSDCQHVDGFKRILPMIVEMVSLRCDASKAGAHRFKLYPDVAKLDLLARHLYIFQFETYINPVFIKRDFHVLTTMMGMDIESVNSITRSIRGAPCVSEFRNEQDLLNEAIRPFVKDLKLSEEDLNEGQLQWIFGYLFHHPQLLGTWRNAEYTSRLIKLLEGKFEKYFLDDSEAYNQKWQIIVKVQTNLESAKEPTSEDMEFTDVEVKSDEESKSNRLIFDYPVDYSTSIWLSIAVYLILVFTSYFIGYFYWGLVVSILPSFWVFKDAMSSKKVIFSESHNLEIYEGNFMSKISVDDILRVEKSRILHGEEILIIFKDIKVASPLRVSSSFHNYKALLSRLENIIGDRILDTSECFSGV